MKNPLRKRHIRELKHDFGKYLVIFLLMALSVGFVSGFFVSDGSITTAYNESFAKYNVEDGNFTSEKKLNKAQKKKIEEAGVTVYENFFVDAELTNNTTLRFYKIRTQVDKSCLWEGRMPESAEEIVIDRVYAGNNGLSIGDSISDGNVSFRITGFVALSDYSSLYKNNTDTMFDAISFGLAEVTEDGFARLSDTNLKYRYSWKYDTAPADEAEENNLSEDFMKVLAGEIHLESYVPRYTNQAIIYYGTDSSSDIAMSLVVLYIIIVIMAFVFAITISNTIMMESTVIGTLRASGYTRMELVRHYMAMPLLVTLISAGVGNLLGYTVFDDMVTEIVLDNYSLCTYEELFSAEAFLKTTVVPVILMIVITFLVLARKMRISPLQFLRGNTKNGGRKKVMRLSPHFRFIDRFRLRIIFQNVGSYIVMFIGVLFANLLLIFGMGFPNLLDNFKNEMESNLLANYQYILQMPYDAMNEDAPIEALISMTMFSNAVETKNEDAEKFSVATLNSIPPEGYIQEEVMLYGVDDDSKYISTDASGSEVYISRAFAEKYMLSVGDSVTLAEKYEDTEYTFTVKGIYEYSGSLSVFMQRDYLNEIMDYGSEFFNGYLSDTEITDIDAQYVSSVIDVGEVTKLSEQLDVSMGNYMSLVAGFAVVIFVILIYLLSKLIIEKNAQSISMIKILGYTNREIGGLYIISTSIVVVLCLLLSLPIEDYCMQILFRVVMMQMSGWLTYSKSSDVYVQMFVVGVITYAAVALLELWKIRKVPMSEALKNVE